MEWALLLGFGVIVLLATLGCHLSNRRLFSLMRHAENCVKRRCMQRSALQIETFLSDCDIPRSQHAVAKQVLFGIAEVLGVTPERLRPDDKLGRLCLVQFPEEQSTHSVGLFAFSEDLLDFISTTLTQREYNAFLCALGITQPSDSRLWEILSDQPLANVVRLIAGAKVRQTSDSSFLTS